ncbi:hypothetical protein DXA34_10085 [[Clostridium] symbiosum]|nr:hypothetical protein DXA34_10085 [[Clostridium] symbiosum]
MNWFPIESGDLVKQVRTPPVRPADGVVGWFYESFVPGEDCRCLGLRAKIKARFSPGRKTPPSVSAPSTGLRPLIVSRVKCGGGPCRGHLVIPCAGNMICLQCAFMKKLR